MRRALRVKTSRDAILPIVAVPCMILTALWSASGPGGILRALEPLQWPGPDA